LDVEVVMRVGGVVFHVKNMAMGSGCGVLMEWMDVDGS